MSKIFKSNFLSADKAAEFLSIFEPTVAQIQTISSKLTREAEGIVIKTELEKMPEGWISGKYFSASLASQESQESSSSKPSWNSPKKFKDFGLNPVTADRKEWRHKADIFRKMVKANEKPSFHKIKIEPSGGESVESVESVKHLKSVKSLNPRK